MVKHAGDLDWHTSPACTIVGLVHFVGSSGRMLGRQEAAACNAAAISQAWCISKFRLADAPPHCRGGLTPETYVFVCTWYMKLATAPGWCILTHDITSGPRFELHARTLHTDSHEPLSTLARLPVI